MKKKNYLHLLSTIMAVMLSFSLASCGGDDDDEPQKDQYEKTENLSNQDPEGTIVLNMVSGAKDNYYTIGELGSIHIDAANNFVGRYSDIDFVTIGKVDGLGKIDRIPNTGWGKSAAVVPGTGYVMRHGYSSSYQYARIYVVDYLGSTYTDDVGNTYGEITGATIKYQAPFQLPIKLDITSLSFDSGANSKTLELTNPTTISIEEKPDWCEVFINTESKITITVTENLTAEQRQGDIVLKNTSNSVKISVTQKGSSSPMFQAGSGTAQDPYQIKTAQQLKSITKALNAHFILTADITLNEEVNGSGWDPIGKQETPFKGSIDGQGHYIKNMWIKRPTTDGVGLFGYIQNATITGICLEIGNNALNGGTYVGGICGSTNGQCTIGQCYVTGKITGSSIIGGICGIAYKNTTIDQCFTDGSISTTKINWYEICSGIAGEGGTITNCYSKATLTGYDCYGISNGGNVSKCYYAGKVPSSCYYFSCTGSYTYYESNLTTPTHSISDPRNGRSASEMMSQSNYEGWDFTSIWKITEGKSYPTLRYFDK